MMYTDWADAETMLHGTTYHHTSTARGYVSRKAACKVVPSMASLGADMRYILLDGTAPNIATLLIMCSDFSALQPRFGGAFLLPCIC